MRVPIAISQFIVFWLTIRVLGSLLAHHYPAANLFPMDARGISQWATVLMAAGMMAFECQMAKVNHLEE